jgi:hypothetical protein
LCEHLKGLVVKNEDALGEARLADVAARSMAAFVGEQTMADTFSYASPLLFAEDKRFHGEHRFLPCAAFRDVSFPIDVVGRSASTH